MNGFDGFDSVIVDGSYNMAIINGKLDSISGLAMYGQRRRVKVILTTADVLPTADSYVRPKDFKNNTIVVDKEGTIIFTRKEYVKKIPWMVDAKFDTYEEASKYGTPRMANLDTLR